MGIGTQRIVAARIVVIVESQRTAASCVAVPRRSLRRHGYFDPHFLVYLQIGQVGVPSLAAGVFTQAEAYATELAGLLRG